MQPQGLTYPCEFPLKLFVRPDPEVERRLQALLASHLAEGAELTLERRTSTKGNYVCLTFNFVAENEPHVLRITAAVRADPGVVLSL